MMRQYEQSMKQNMKSAEDEYREDPEHRRGFVIGGIQKLWEVYQGKQINGQQFDQLIAILSGFSKGEYKDFIADLVKDYKSGNPPTIIGS
jgi:hypothetical protein